MAWMNLDGSRPPCTCATKKAGEVCVPHMNEDQPAAAAAAATIDEEWEQLDSGGG